MRGLHLACFDQKLTVKMVYASMDGLWVSFILGMQILAHLAGDSLVSKLEVYSSSWGSVHHVLSEEWASGQNN